MPARAALVAAVLLSVRMLASGIPPSAWQVPAADSWIPIRLAATFGGDMRATPEEVEAAVVTPAFFPAGLTPVVGRFIQAADGGEDDYVPVVIGNGLYHSRFDGSLDAIATPILIEGQKLSVVGVAPQAFTLASAGWLWLPRFTGAADDPRVAMAGALDGEWEVELVREGPAFWPAGEPERPLTGNVRGRLTMAAVRVPVCAGCLAIRGTLRVPLTVMLPSPTPVRRRLLPERPAGDESRAVSGLALPDGRLQLRTTSGDCQLCGEIAFDAASVGQAFTGTWTLETAAVARPGDRGTLTMRRVRAPGVQTGGSASRRPRL